MKNVCIRIFVSGKVQGVFFRNNMKKNAENFDVFGWVRNLEDGRVEAVFEGKKDNVNKLIKWSKVGHFLSKVENVKIKEEKYTGEFNSFKIKY